MSGKTLRYKTGERPWIHSDKINQTRIRDAHLGKNVSCLIARPTYVDNEPLNKTFKFHKNLSNGIPILPRCFRRLGEPKHDIDRIRLKNKGYRTGPPRSGHDQEALLDGRDLSINCWNGNDRFRKMKQGDSSIIP